MMIAFIKVPLRREDINCGRILEAYPRTAFQAEELDFLLDTLEQKFRLGNLSASVKRQ
jgi:adenylate kinase